jgi:hypothetical protein
MRAREIIMKIKQHAKEKHPSIPFDETQLHAYIYDR